MSPWQKVVNSERKANMGPALPQEDNPNFRFPFRLSKNHPGDVCLDHFSYIEMFFSRTNFILQNVERAPCVPFFSGRGFTNRTWVRIDSKGIKISNGCLFPTVVRPLLMTARNSGIITAITDNHFYIWLPVKKLNKLTVHAWPLIMTSVEKGIQSKAWVKNFAWKSRFEIIFNC